MMSDPRTINRIKRVIERKFSYYPKTKEVLDLKEELLSIVLDKYNDLETGTENQKYKECMAVMMSSYKQVLHDLEVESSKKILKDKLMGFSIFGTIYFLIIILIYMIVSKFVVGSFKKTYFIVLAPSIIFLWITVLFTFTYCKKMNFKILTRVFLGLSFLTFAVALYTVPSLYCSIYENIKIWHPAWLVIFVVGSCYVFVDSFLYPNKKPYTRLIRNCLNLLALFTTIYLIVSIITGYWYVTWLTFVLWLIGCEINVFLFFKRQI